MARKNKTSEPVDRKTSIDPLPVFDNDRPLLVIASPYFFHQNYHSGHNWNDFISLISSKFNTIVFISQYENYSETVESFNNKIRELVSPYEYIKLVPASVSRLNANNYTIDLIKDIVLLNNHPPLFVIVSLVDSNDIIEGFERYIVSYRTPDRRSRAIFTYDTSPISQDDLEALTCFALDKEYKNLGKGYGKAPLSLPADDDEGYFFGYYRL